MTVGQMPRDRLGLGLGWLTRSDVLENAPHYVERDHSSTSSSSAQNSSAIACKRASSSASSAPDAASSGAASGAVARLQRGPARDSTQSSLTNLQADEISLVASLPFSRYGPPSGRAHHDQSERARPYTQFPALPAGRGICRNANACSKFGLSESHPHAGVAHDLSRLCAGNAIRLGWLKCPSN